MSVRKVRRKTVAQLGWLMKNPVGRIFMWKGEVRANIYSGDEALFPEWRRIAINRSRRFRARTAREIQS